MVDVLDFVQFEDEEEGSGAECMLMEWRREGGKNEGRERGRRRREKRKTSRLMMQKEKVIWRRGMEVKGSEGRVVYGQRGKGTRLS
jgi:hypothetical protein